MAHPRFTPSSVATRCAPNAISARQAQVAALVARGESNREIALALRLSPRTVDAHLAALFNKLNVSSRTELTAALSLPDAEHAIVPAPKPPNLPALHAARVRRSRLHPLSARQTEVAGLVAGGEPNREIARALRLSPRTVDAHLAALFDRLNITSRGQLAAVLAVSNASQGVVPVQERSSNVAASRTAHIRCRWVGKLSACQAQVAALIALGKSNREIGAALWLSSRTVATHVNSLFNKHNVSSRWEMIAVLYRQDSEPASRPQRAIAPRPT